MSEIDQFLAFVENLVKQSGESETELSRRLTDSPDTFRDARRKASMPGAVKMQRMAERLGIPSEQILGKAASSPAPPSRIEAVPANMGDVTRALRAMPGGLPVYGTALGHNIQFDEDGGAEIEVTLYEPSNAILYVARPPALMDVKEAYGFYVQGDSMAPAHKDGVLRFANPRAPIRVTDDVVVQLRAPIDDGQDGEEIVSVLVKTLVKRTASHITLEQLNPHARFNVPTDRVAAIHRVMEMDDLFRR